MAGLADRQDEEGLAGAGNHRSVAEYIGVPPIAAYEVASFYNMYDPKPVGAYQS